MWNHRVTCSSDSKILIRLKLNAKYSRIRTYGCERALKMALGQCRGPALENGHTFTAPIRSLSSHVCSWKSVTLVRKICDEFEEPRHTNRERPIPKSRTPK